MNKFVALVQLAAALLLVIITGATAVNLILISTRPETISVVNTLIGQGILIICLLVIVRILLKKGMAGLRGSNSATDSKSPVD
ncbi:MAG: hypothetical protein COA96_13690 [SAR86 cluster bacterium]|uniref:Uncharacterized protein n=1 Tax=SAR86 cluster bacterium TaxID=2030880 RepID=A0A2A5AV92_9GAMM|nr:MAG: hypothetical protein COA96_13690 [SAR86 cluster bacterium]